MIPMELVCDILPLNYKQLSMFTGETLEWEISITDEEQKRSCSIMINKTHDVSCGRGCICWGILVSAGSREAHGRLC